MAYHGNRALLATYKPAIHQEIVDSAQARIRADLAAGRRSLFKPPPPGPGRSDAVLDQRMAEELSLMIRELEVLGGALASDPILLRRHALHLQSIDRMQQVLGHLARIAEARDKQMAVDQVSLAELKGRLRRGALRSITD